MKQLIYILFLLVSFGQALFAQSVETELLEVRLLERMPFPLGKDWYQAQKEGWKAEVMKDKKDVRAWENYLSACDVEYWEEMDSLQKQKLDKERHKAFRKMQKCVPDTRFCYQRLLDQVKDKKKEEVLLQKLFSLKRTSELDYVNDIIRCQRAGQTDKIKEICKEWYSSGLYSYDLLSYCYNELVGLQENAIFVSGAYATLCYHYLLQYGAGLFKNVQIVDADDFNHPSSESEFWREIGMDSEELPDWKTMAGGNSKSCSWDSETSPKWKGRNNPGAWYLTVKKNRPVYYPQFTSTSYLKELKDSLYSEGLVFRYSTKPYDNLAVIRKNYEQKYLLDCLRQPLVQNSSVYFSGINYSKNYIVSLSPLLRFYDASGDKNQAIKLRHLLQGILDRREEDEIVSVERAEFNKLMKAVADRIKDMIKQGTTTVTVNSIKEEYQQLIDPVEP